MNYKGLNEDDHVEDIEFSATLQMSISCEASSDDMLEVDEGADMISILQRQQHQLKRSPPNMYSMCYIGLYSQYAIVGNFTFELLLILTHGFMWS